MAGSDFTPQPAVPLAVLLLTFNEEENLRLSLPGLRMLQCPIILVDSGSTDGTQQIAQENGCLWLEHKFTNHTEQWRWALGNLPVRADWVLALDADQRLTPELAREIPARLALTAPGQAEERVQGFYLNRRHIFRGRWLRHGALYPKYLLKLVRPDQVYFDAKDLVDHHFLVPGLTASLRGDLIEENRKEGKIQFWIDKHNRYARAMAREQMLRSEPNAAHGLTPQFWGSPDERILWLKLRWYSLPLYWRPWLYFVYRYILRGGFLDGRQGFIFHFLQALWFRLLVDINYDELKQASKERQSPYA